MFSITKKLDLQLLFPSKVSIWKSRSNNPMRKSFQGINIKTEQFDALIKITAEMSKYLYPYIRSILSSRDNLINNPELWNEFQLRYTELIEERFNTESILVKNLINKKYSYVLFGKILLTLALCSSEEGYSRLRLILFSF